jgi:hypothetical protein
MRIPIPHCFRPDLIERAEQLNALGVRYEGYLIPLDDTKTRHAEFLWVPSWNMVLLPQWRMYYVDSLDHAQEVVLRDLFFQLQ